MLVVAKYQMANALDPGNSKYRNRLADLYLSRGELDRALNTLGDSNLERLRKADLLMQYGRYDDALRALDPLENSIAAAPRSYVYLEKGDTDQAISTLVPPQNDAQTLQLGIAYAVNNNATAVQLLQGKGSDGTTLELKKAGASRLGLAQILYSRHLYRTTQRVLETTGDSAAKFLLLADATLAQQPRSHERLLAAQDAIQQGIGVDPSNIPLHELMRSLRLELGDNVGASREDQVLRQLRDGTI